MAEALRAVGATVEVHDDHFPVDAPDEVWLAAAGERGWVVLTKDKRVRHRATEWVAATEARAALFVLTAGNLTGEEVGRAFIAALPRMIRLATAHARPFLARVAGSGEVSLAYPG